MSSETLQPEEKERKELLWMSEYLNQVANNRVSSIGNL